jgi:hypothetical protein
MIKAYASIICALLAGLTVFQFALICGVHLGHFAWGGAYEVLPDKLRVGSGFSICLYAAFALIALQRARVIHWIKDERIINKGVWIITAYSFLGILVNGISRSIPERSVMTPVSIVLAVCFLQLARYKEIKVTIKKEES